MATIRFPLFAVAVVLMVSFISPAQDTSPAILLENDLLSLQVLPSPTPHIGKLIHKHTGTPLISEPQDHELFELTFDDGDGKQKSLPATAAAQTNVSVIETNGQREIIMQWSAFPGLDVSVQATVRLADGEPLTLCPSRLTTVPAAI